MPRARVKLLLFLLVHLLTVVGVLAQTTEQPRDSEWKNHKLPAVEFARYVDLEKVVMFRVPATWETMGPLRFRGPEGSELRVVVEKFPDGAPLKSYTNALLQSLRNLPGGADAVTARSTEISALEAREFLFNLSDAEGLMTRRLLWSTVSGAHAVSFILIEPEAKAAEIEPYFKAVVESAVIFESAAHYEIFERLRSAAIKEAKPARLDEVRSLVSVIRGFDADARAKAVAALARIFDSAPDSAIELLIDRRPLVRAAAVEAVARSSNRMLDGFLVQALADNSSDVAMRAARALAKREDAVKLLREDSANWEGLQIERVMRAMAMLDDRARNQIAEELTKRPATFSVKASKGRRPTAPPPPPPPAVRSPGDKDKSAHRTGPPLEIRVAPAGIPSGIPGGVPGGIPSFSFGLVDAPGSNDEYVVLGMLPDLEPVAAALPVAAAIESGGPAATLALRIALESRTKLPVDLLMKTLSATDNQVSLLAAKNLAVSASGADIPRMEAFSKTIFTVSASKPGDLGHERPLSDELTITAKKVRWRERFASATNAATRDPITREGLEDNDLAAFAWPYVRDLIEGPGPKQAKPLRTTGQAHADAPEAPRQVSMLGENLLPRTVKLYAAIPDAQGFVDKLAGSLSSIQLESARTQANLLLVMKAIEAQIAKVFDAPMESGILESSGIKPHSPIVVASWTAAGAPRGLRAAERKAVIVRVADRDRFEHLIATYQRQLGRFDMLPEYISAGARFISMLPALLPFAAQAMGGEKVLPQPRFTTSYHLMGSESCNGYPVTVIERREVGAAGQMNRDTVYLTYIGDAAVMAPDWFSLRDSLSRLEGKGETLASNADFKRAAAAGGDVIYLSDPLALFGSAKKADRVPVVELGALNITKPGWESSFELAVSDQAWKKPLAFKPSELKAPAELLPRSSIAYLFMKLDFAPAWHSFGRDMFGLETVKQFESLWALDFEREVLPELGNELGAALLGLPSLKGAGFEAPWVLFVQTRSDKLSQAFADGKLLKDTPAGAKAVRVKMGSSVYWFAVKNGFLIIAGSEASIAKLDSNEHLSSARDFERASKNTPGEVIAFGGTNIQAAADSIKIDQNDPLMAQGVATLLSLARAFHSQNIFATANDRGLAARMSVSLDREGRFSLSELSALSKEFQFAAAEVEARGAPIPDQKRVDALTLRITSKAQGAIDRIKEDISTPAQVADKRSDSELLVTTRPRRPAPSKKVELPVTASEFEPFLKAANGISSNDPNVIARAREIAGQDRDAWSVALKLSDWTFKNLKWKRVDDANAAQTLATREADCLEFSQLFVAMARAVGMPARIVTGLAHTGGSFGGHAWVEVWVGEWVELDPTWGTNFVDATHIKTASFELGAYAALNLIGIEVVEARRAVPDFQTDPGTLAGALCEQFNGADRDALAVALDPGVLVDAFMGAGSWEGMSAAERDRVYSSHRRVNAEVHQLFNDQYQFGAGARLLKLNKQQDGAEAILMPAGFSTALIRIHFVRRGQAWFVREVKYDDLDYNMIAEMMGPTVSALQARRRNSQTPQVLDSILTRILQARRQNVKVALKIAEHALKDDPNNQTLRYLKAVYLLESAEEDKAAVEESARILNALAAENPAFLPAIRRLGVHYAAADQDDPERKSKRAKAIELLQRYASMIPEDPRPHDTLADVYEAQDDAARAEAERRAVIQLDPLNPIHYSDLGRFLVAKGRYKEALAAIDQSKGRGISKGDAFANLFMVRYGEPSASEQLEGLATAAPERLAASFRANLNLASVRIENGRPSEALPLLKRAAELDPTNGEPHTSMAQAHRKLHSWAAALRSADQAIKLDDTDAEAHFHRACALAQLRRPTEAMAALRKAVELDEELLFTDDLEEEQDLKPLAAMAGFKKLIEETKRTEQDPPAPRKKDNDK